MALTASQRQSARSILGSLRRTLSQTALRALQPDLVILDEFQRFRDLLDVETGGEAAELANNLFKQPDAHVLLLSATPYKPFTLRRGGRVRHRSLRGLSENAGVPRRFRNACGLCAR